MLDPAKATDQNAFAVTKDSRPEHNLTTLSDLAALHQPITLAAAARLQGAAGLRGRLTSTYGLNIVKIIPLDFDSAQAKDSVTPGESQLGEVATTDGALAREGLVDPAGRQGHPARAEPHPGRQHDVPQGAPGCGDPV